MFVCFILLSHTMWQGSSEPGCSGCIFYFLLVCQIVKLYNCLDFEGPLHKIITACTKQEVHDSQFKLTTHNSQLNKSTTHTHTTQTHTLQATSTTSTFHACASLQHISWKVTTVSPDRIYFSAIQNKFNKFINNFIRTPLRCMTTAWGQWWNFKSLLHPKCVKITMLTELMDITRHLEPRTRIHMTHLYEWHWALLWTSGLSNIIYRFRIP